MNSIIGWALAALALAAGYVGWGWRGVGLGITVVVFWLLLQWSRALRVLRLAAGRPKGHVDSAVMLQAKLVRGMTLLQVLPQTLSLGEVLPTTDGSEVFRWSDESGASVTLTLRDGRVTDWQLNR
ncbi:hypothetical protein BurJ1DRAFT_0198 [Burkholderiales bacterium JOSHI_001]|nr:hypothetical protein BurJ1DRAFT_0198 [Burkholderiales bacterium JOSHI_001]